MISKRHFCVYMANLKIVNIKVARIPAYVIAVGVIEIFTFDQ